VREELERLGADTISILDVGAGPLTRLGYRFPGKTLEVVAVDPLAGEYDRLLREAGLVPPVRTIAVAGEELLEHFGSRRFDIAYATNALDHSADPLAIIENMVTLVRPGGAVLLRHKRNEGQSAGYGGLHQWNFDVVGDRLVVWNDASRVDLGTALGARVAATAWISDGEVVARLAVGEAQA
jgi:SAM-dependent methyltransferase